MPVELASLQAIPAHSKPPASYNGYAITHSASRCFHFSPDTFPRFIDYLLSLSLSLSLCQPAVLSFFGHTIYLYYRYTKLFSLASRTIWRIVIHTCLLGL